MHILLLPHGCREAAGQVDPEILSLLHGWKLEAGPGLPEPCLFILDLPHGKEPGCGKQKSSIKLQKKAAPWSCFHSGIDE
jgi:hypothetical protein